MYHYYCTHSTLLGLWKIWSWIKIRTAIWPLSVEEPLSLALSQEENVGVWKHLFTHLIETTEILHHVVPPLRRYQICLSDHRAAWLSLLSLIYRINWCADTIGKHCPLTETSVSAVSIHFTACISCLRQNVTASLMVTLTFTLQPWAKNDPVKYQGLCKGSSRWD